MNAETAQRYARWVGVLYVITIISAGWGEAHVPSVLLLADDVAGTAHKVATSVELFRASFIAYLAEATVDIVLNVLFYALLRPVSRYLRCSPCVSGSWRLRSTSQERCCTLLRPCPQ